MRALRPAALGLALALSARPASAATAGPYTGEGRLRWSFDDVSVEAGQKKSKRSSWSQNYEYAVSGPLGARALGEGRTSLAFSDGIDPNLAANTESPRRRSLNYNFSGELFRPELRGFVRARPNFTWNETRQAGSSGQPPRTLLLNTWGLSGGGGLPGVFSLDVSRQFSRRRDPASGQGVDEYARNGSENFSLLMGRARLVLERQYGRIADRLGDAPARAEEWRVARLEGNYFDLRRLKVSALSFRGEYRDQRADQSRQREGVGDLNLRTMPWEIGRWSHTGAYAGLLRRDALARTDTASQTFSVDSQTELRPGPLRNTVSASHAAGPVPARSVGETLSLSQGFRSGKVSLSESGGGTWSEASGSPARLGDSATLRLSVMPTPWRSISAQWQMNGQSVNGGGGSRSHRGELSGQQSVANRARLSGRYERSRMREYATELVTTADILNAQATGSPLESVEASLAYDLSFYRTSAGAPRSTRSASLGAEYRPNATFSASGRVAWTGGGRDYFGSLNWTLGKTTLSLFVERRESSVYQRYTQLSVSLTRLL